MGLIKAAQAATGTVMADQWKEFFYCDSLDNDTLLVRGKKRTGSRSSNTNGNDNIISNGSGIAVADGQCMLIVDQGKIAEVCAEPGEYTYDTSSEPSIFAGNLSASIRILPEPDVLLPLQVELHINIQRPDSAIRDLQEHYKTEQVYL